MVAVTDFKIEELVPHASPMVLIDEPISADQDHFSSLIKVKSDNLFYDDDIRGIPSWVIMEMMAQTIAAYAGFQEILANKPVRVGFLLGTRKFQSNISHLELNQEYVVTVNKLYQEYNGLGSFACSMTKSETVIATANLNVFSPENVNEFLNKRSEL
ncbi:3-hydroxylacyl-ACP dehydratase [Pleionea sediminis]|uniref:ApeP family dehydratase n=1 Tax=Pleionea sediminis TaxID=2569479 RepID=UPI0011855AB3|nr:3-hydroxylacyl-ACP dehydratase [Pleionea sediminis]